MNDICRFVNTRHFCNNTPSYFSLFHFSMWFNAVGSYERLKYGISDIVDNIFYGVKYDFNSRKIGQ